MHVYYVSLRFPLTTTWPENHYGRFLYIAILIAAASICAVGGEANNVHKNTTKYIQYSEGICEALLNLELKFDKLNTVE